MLAILGRHLAARGRLKRGVVVTTVMANLGLDRALKSAGVRTVKTQVGDRYVLEEMLRSGPTSEASNRVTCSSSITRAPATASSPRCSSCP